MGTAVRGRYSVGVHHAPTLPSTDSDLLTDGPSALRVVYSHIQITIIIRIICLVPEDYKRILMMNFAS